MWNTWTNVIHRVNRDGPFIRPSLTKFEFAQLNCIDGLYTEFYSTWMNNTKLMAKFTLPHLFCTPTIFIKPVIAEWSGMENFYIGFIQSL